MNVSVCDGLCLVVLWQRKKRERASNRDSHLASSTGKIKTKNSWKSVSVSEWVLRVALTVALSASPHAAASPQAPRPTTKNKQNRNQINNWVQRGRYKDSERGGERESCCERVHESVRVRVCVCFVWPNCGSTQRVCEWKLFVTLLQAQPHEIAIKSAIARSWKWVSGKVCGSQTWQKMLWTSCVRTWFYVKVRIFSKG